MFSATTARVVRLAALAFGLTVAGGAAAQEARAPIALDWSFEGVFGTYDQAAAQRGLQVFLNVCSNCHSLRQVAYRHLTGIGYEPDQIAAIAAEKQVTDGPDKYGEMFERPGKPSDFFVPPFPNDQAARYANGGALPPDLSVIVAARVGGADYVYSLLTGFGDPPPGEEIQPGMNYNPYFPGSQIAMPQPLFDGMVGYQDGTEATTKQMARDVATFLAWASQPELEQRKRIGFKVILFLIVLAGLLFASKRRLWASLH